MYSLSRFSRRIKVDEDVFAIFNNLLREVYYLDRKTLEELEKGNYFNESSLFDAGILIKSESDDIELLNAFKNAITKEHTNINLVYIIPSSSCNLKCNYCYIYNKSNISTNTINMTRTVIDEFLEKYVCYLNKNKVDEASVIFYGGEPLCNWDIVEYCIEKGMSMYPFNFSIITNATLFDDVKIDFLKRYDVGIGISIDGIKDITDKHRRFKNSNESVFDKVIHIIDVLLKSNIKLALSVTITDEFLDHQEAILKFFEEIGIKDINYNLLHSHKDIENFESYYDKATDFLINSFERLSSKDIIDDRITRKIDSFIKGHFYYADCGAAYANQIVVKPNGGIGVCQGEFNTNDVILGNILSDDLEKIASNSERISWKNKLPIFNSHCISCEAISLCGGGCLVQAKEIGHNNIDSAFCVHTKKVFKWLLKKLYEAQ